MNNRKRRFGDRKEGRRLRTLSPYLALTAFIMPQRNDASNMFAERVEISKAEKYLHEKRAQGYKGMGLLHLFLAGYVRSVSQRPALNRFVSGQRVFARNRIEVVMTIKKFMTSVSDDTSIKVVFEPTDTAIDVYNRCQKAVGEVKGDSSNNVDSLAKTFISLPRGLLRFAIWFLNKMDYHGWLPAFLLDASPFHASLLITDLGSIGIKPIFHHIYNFGNIPLAVAMGNKYMERSPELDGTITEKKYIDYKIVCDERTCDGFYYAFSFKHFKDYVLHPEKLDVPPEQVFEDID